MTPHNRRQPKSGQTLLLAGASLAGLLAALLLRVNAGSQSQVYFVRNALPLMAIGSAAGLSALWDDASNAARRAVVWGAGAGSIYLLILYAGFDAHESPSPGLATTGVLRLLLLAVVISVAAGLAGFRARSKRPTRLLTAATALAVAAVAPGLIVQFTTPLPPGPPAKAPDQPWAFSADQIEAARWLRDNSSEDDVVMTNRHCVSPHDDPCDSRRFVIAAYTERPVLLEGWAYTLSWTRSPVASGGTWKNKPFWDQELLALNDDFLADPTALAAAELWDLGVRWIYIDKTVPWSSRLEDYGEPAFQTAWSAVFRLAPPDPA